jgi:hypothetical protein
MAFEEIAQPTSLDERIELARRTCDELELSTTMLIDTLDDRSRAYFGDLPSPAIVIGPDGRVRVKLPWAEPDVLAPRLEALLAALGAADLPPDAAPRAKVAAALRAGRAAGEVDRDALEALSAELAELQPEAELQTLVLTELARDPATIAAAAAAARAAWPDDPDRLAAALARLVVGNAGSPSAAALLAEIETLAGESAPTQRAWVRARRRSEPADGKDRAGEGPSERGRRVVEGPKARGTRPAGFRPRTAQPSRLSASSTSPSPTSTWAGRSPAASGPAASTA